MPDMNPLPGDEENDIDPYAEENDEDEEDLEDEDMIDMMSDDDDPGMPVMIGNHRGRNGYGSRLRNQAQRDILFNGPG
jgi:hypothetical protein